MRQRAAGNLALNSNDPPMFFVMPHYRENDAQAYRYFREAIQGLFAQTDPHWQLMIVDDASPAPVRRQLQQLAEQHRGKIHVILEDNNRGAGHCRNIGIRAAAERGARIILFHDADDISHPERVARTREIFASRPDIDVIYAPFEVIDEQGGHVPVTQLTPSIRQILDVYRHPPQGRDIWIDMGTRTGYINLTSATSVRTELALRQPFPEQRVSEDFHTWMRYAADGGYFHFEPSIPTHYRIPRHKAGSHSRARIGRDFYLHKAAMDTDGFEQAMHMALQRNTISSDSIPQLRRSFRQKLQQLLAEEGITLPTGYSHTE